MPKPDQQSEWYKSSLSGTGECVEMRVAGGHVLVRDSKHPDGPVLSFTPTEWFAFTGGVRLGEFDLAD